MRLEEFSANYLPLVDAYLSEHLQQSDQMVGAFYGMMHYHLGWVDAKLQPARSSAGKRLRPLVCLLCCRAAGGEPEQALPAASALELVHCFSLVHDDIEDGSSMRRGRPTVWAVWGAAQALNVGDGLFALARLSLLRLADAGVPVERTLAAAQVLDRACLELCEGQFLDMSFETMGDVTLEQYLSMIRLKTAALLCASAEIGATVAAQDEATIARLRSFGENLGLAFQIQDDVLGIWGEEEVTGKSAATDLRDKKKTLPVLHALRWEARSTDGPRLAAIFGQSGPMDETACSQALAILTRAQSQAYAETMATHYLQRALDDLAGAGIPEADRELLRSLAKSLASRKV